MLLENKVALITGASSGIGLSTALLFAKNGAKLAILGRRQTALEEVAATIKSQGHEALIITADVTDAKACKAAISTTISTFHKLDILVNAAGVIGNGTIENTSVEAWRNMLNVNLEAVFNLMQLAIPHLEKTRGNIVNLSSITGLRAFPGVLAYCVSKAGVDQLTRCAALELGPKGIRVNAINPGVVETNLHKRGGFDDKKYAEFLEHGKSTHPLGRVGQPEEVAEAILYLASDNAAWVTGETLSVDGGRQLTCAR